MNFKLFLLMALGGLFFLVEPALANKFETISGGVTGSMQMKREFVQNTLLVLGGGFLAGAVLAIVVPHTHAAFLNYANWKLSSAVMATLGMVMLLSYLFI